MAQSTPQVCTCIIVLHVPSILSLLYCCFEHDLKTAFYLKTRLNVPRTYWVHDPRDQPSCLSPLSIVTPNRGQVRPKRLTTTPAQFHQAECTRMLPATRQSLSVYMTEDIPRTSGPSSKSPFATRQSQPSQLVQLQLRHS